MALMFTGYGGPVLRILENRVFAVLSRLTYTAYLIHPAIIFLVYLDNPYPVHFSPVWYGFSLIGMVVVVFAFSAIVFLMVEKPLATVERLLLVGAKKED